MLTFMIRALDRPDAGDLRSRTRATHLDHLAAHGEHLVTAGAILAADGSTPVGSLLVVAFPEERDARAFIDSDPYALAGLFATIEICRLRLVPSRP